MTLDSDGGDDFAFLKEAVGSLSVPGAWLPLLLVALFQPAAHLLMLWTLPTAQNPDHGPYVAAFAAIVLVYVVFALATLRIMNSSPRPAWSPDWSACVYAALVL